MGYRALWSVGRYIETVAENTIKKVVIGEDTQDIKMRLISSEMLSVALCKKLREPSSLYPRWKEVTRKTSLSINLCSTYANFSLEPMVIVSVKIVGLQRQIPQLFRMMETS